MFSIHSTITIHLFVIQMVIVRNHIIPELIQYYKLFASQISNFGLQPQYNYASGLESLRIASNFGQICFRIIIESVLNPDFNFG